MIDRKNFHVFEKGGSNYLFLTEPVAVFNIDENTAEALSRAERGEVPEEAFLQKRLKEAETFIDNYCSKAPPAKLMRTPKDITDKVAALTLFVSQECNLKCSYCYGNEGEYGHRGRMSETTLGRTFDTFFSKGDGKHFIVLFGGEPLMNFPLVKKTASLKDEYRSEGKADISLGIVTNGTFCDDEIIDFFNEHIDDVTFSLDGPEDLNDGQRVAKRGEGVYRQATENIQRMTAKGGFNWGFRSVVTRQGCERIEEIYDDLARFQPGGIGIVNADAPKDSPLGLSDEQYDKFVDQIIRINSKGLKSFVEGEQAIAFEYPFYILFYFVARCHALYHCNAGANLLAVTAEGDVYPCHRFVGEESFKMGNVADPDLRQSARYRQIRQQFINTTVDQREGCRDCWARYLCGGSCVKLSHAQHGNLSTPTQRHCEYIHRVIEEILPEIIDLVRMPETREALVGRLKSALRRSNGSRHLDAGDAA